MLSPSLTKHYCNPLLHNSALNQEKLLCNIFFQLSLSLSLKVTAYKAVFRWHCHPAAICGQPTAPLCQDQPKQHRVDKHTARNRVPPRPPLEPNTKPKSQSKFRRRLQIQLSALEGLTCAWQPALTFPRALFSLFTITNYVCVWRSQLIFDNGCKNGPHCNECAKHPCLDKLEEE